MDGPKDYHTKSEINQRQISHITNITYMRNLKKKKDTMETYLQNRTALTDIEDKLRVTNRERVGRDTFGAGG